jgi:hypothetical protein
MYSGMKLLVVAAILTAIAVVPAQAACPPGAVGNTAAEIAAERQRILCLQRELAEDTARRRQQIEIDALNRSIQQMQMQQRLNALPVYQPPTFQ